ncbi:MAG: hypothetical protein ACR2QH_19340 [Geminicoccaceae bacterium]
MMRPTRSKAELRAAEISRRDRAFQKESVNEREERAKKTARLRALRLAKEADERELAKRLAAEKAAAMAKVPAGKARSDKRRPATEDSASAPPNADLAGS